jgi:hypothetical protein
MVLLPITTSYYVLLHFITYCWHTFTDINLSLLAAARVETPVDDENVTWIHDIGGEPSLIFDDTGTLGDGGVGMDIINNNM